LGGPDLSTKEVSGDGRQHDAAVAAIHSPAVRDRLLAPGAEIAPDSETSPQFPGALVKSEKREMGKADQGRRRYSTGVERIGHHRRESVSTKRSGRGMVRPASLRRN